MSPKSFKMNTRNLYSKNILAFLIVFGVIVVLYFLLSNNAYQQKQSNNNSYEPYRTSLSGEYVCLPHKDTSGPQTLECAFGLRTESGEHYAVDLNLMSQEHRALVTGEYISANGLVTPIERLSNNYWHKYDVVGIFSVTDSLVVNKKVNEPYACDGDAKICPDGTVVGREGPSCTFSACPTSNDTSARVTTYLDGTATTFNLNVSPKEVISDSRCPKDVVCVWAGTVEVRTVISTQVAHGEHVLTLGKSMKFGDYTVTLVEVTPEKTSKEIPESSYRFTFEIVRPK